MHLILLGILRQTRVFSFVFLSMVALFVVMPSRMNAGEQRFALSMSGLQKLAVMSIDERGQLGVLRLTAIDGKPGASCFDSTGLYCYVAAADPGTISVHRVEPGGLSHVQTVAAPAKPSYLAIDPSGRYLMAAYHATGQVSVHRIVGEGRLSVDAIELRTIDERAHCVAIDPSGQFVLVPRTRPNAISQFRLDAATGKLSPNDPVELKRNDPVNPRHLWFHPNGRFVYGSNESGCSISAYRFDEANGTLDHLQTESSLPVGHTERASTSDIEVHPNGKFAYIANRRQGTIAIFRINEQTGLMTFIERTATEPNVRSFNISPDGQFLVAAGQGSGNIICYRIAADGRLSETSKLAVGGTPWWVNFYPEVAMARLVNGETTIDHASLDRNLVLGQGTMAGEVTDTSVLLQTRLTAGKELDSKGDLPGAAGTACFQWSISEDFEQHSQTQFQVASSERDFIVRAELTQLRPDTVYYFRANYGATQADTQMGPICSFRTLPGPNGKRPVNFIVGSCMNYIKFMHGKAGNAGGPLTATAEDKRLGFPAFIAMKDLKPDFFVGTGDIVYYDNPYRVSKSVEELRRCWHEQFRFPRMIDFFRSVPTYWSKDDHDFRYNDSDNATDRLPTPSTGIGLFHEQLPIARQDAQQPKPFRTIRVNRDLQIWLTEGRDFRSPNKSPDGPGKSMWGVGQRTWLKSTLQASNARWKLVISPTPMVGPDDAYKKDNHASLQGFRHEADEFFQWVQQNQIDNLYLMCGDRHWQYHSIHPSGVNEFAVGALNDENARMGVPPGADFGTDPGGLIQQPYTSPQPSGGFVQVTVGKTMDIRFYDDQGNQLHSVQFSK